MEATDVNTEPKTIHETSKESKARIKDSLKPYIGDKTLISAREFWMSCVGEDKPIRWVRSYKTLLKYISESYADVFKPTIKGSKSGTRYYVEVDNIVEFLFLFENNHFKKDK